MQGLPRELLRCLPWLLQTGLSGHKHITVSPKTTENQIEEEHVW